VNLVGTDLRRALVACSSTFSTGSEAADFLLLFPGRPSVARTDSIADSPK